MALYRCIRNPKGLSKLQQPIEGLEAYVEILTQQGEAIPEFEYRGTAIYSDYSTTNGSGYPELTLIPWWTQ